MTKPVDAPAEVAALRASVEALNARIAELEPKPKWIPPERRDKDGNELPHGQFRYLGTLFSATGERIHEDPDGMTEDERYLDNQRRRREEDKAFGEWYERRRRLDRDGNPLPPGLWRDPCGIIRDASGRQAVLVRDDDDPTPLGLRRDPCGTIRDDTGRQALLVQDDDPTPPEAA